MSGPLLADPVMWQPLKTRVWVAGPERIVSFDCDRWELHAESTRHGPDGSVVKVPKRMVATDTYGRKRTVFLDKVQPCQIEMNRGQVLPDRPDADWLMAVERWRLKRAMYPGEPAKWWQ